MKWFDAQEKMPEDGWCLIKFTDNTVHGGWMSVDSWQELGVPMWDYRLYDGPDCSDYYGLVVGEIESWMPVEGPHASRDLGWALRFSKKRGGK